MEEAAKVAAKGITWLENHKRFAETTRGCHRRRAGHCDQCHTVRDLRRGSDSCGYRAGLLIIAAVAAVGVGIYVLATHWHQVWGDIKQWTGDAWHWIDGNVVQPVERFFTRDVGQWLSQGVRFFEALPGKVVAALAHIGDDVVSELKAFPGQLLNLFEQGFEDVVAGIIAFDIKAVEYFAKLPGDLVNAVIKFGPGILEWMANAFWALDGAIASGVEDAVKFFAGIPGKLLHAVIEFGPGVAKWMADAFVSLVQVAVDGDIAVTKFFLSLPGKIITALGDATKWLYDVGKDIINGLIKGMEDIIPDVAKTAEHIASGIKNKVTGLLGIHSPSTVFAEIGSNIVAGLAQGINVKAPMATAASSKLVSAAQAGAFGGGTSSASGGSKQPAYITVQIAGKNIGQAFVPDLLAFQKSGGVLAINRQGRAITGTA